jgi:NDP-sugar pyrophosphorylase family protein
MKAIVLAGGKGTRLAPYTKILPKPLMPIGEMPILEVILRQMRCAGVDEVTLAVGHLSELFRAFFNDGNKLDLKIDYSFEDKPLGTAGPLASVGGLTDTFMVSNGDVLTTMDIADLIHFHRENQAIATIAVHARKSKIDFGVIEWDDAPLINGYIEKPTYDFMVSMGMYIFEPQVLNYVEKGKYLDFPDLILRLLAAGEKVAGFHYDGYWQDLGRPDDYESAAQDFENMRAQFLGEECDR